MEPLSPEEQERDTTVEKPRILVAGIGNIFMGDDAFGVEVRTACFHSAIGRRAVRVADFGIRGFDLAYALQDGYETTILIDAYPRGETRQGRYTSWNRIWLSWPEKMEEADVDAHAMDPVKILRLAASMGGPLKTSLAGWL